MAAVSTAWYHTCALTTAGGVKCWGANSRGQLGDGTTARRTTPVDVTGLSSGVAAVTVGGYDVFGHTCGLTTAGGLKCWGNNYSGQLGAETTETCGSPPVPCSTTPLDVTGLTSGVGAVAAGRAHTCALTTAGGVKCWGYNGSGQLGDGTTAHRSMPVDVCEDYDDAAQECTKLFSSVIAIAAGNDHTCALTAAGGVKCWGFNNDGRLGDGTSNNSPTPVDVVGLDGGADAIAAGDSHTCAVTAAGGLKCWGLNFRGQLGDGESCGLECLTPVDVVGLESGVTAISAGGSHTCAVTTAGGVKCWGGNRWGQLGDGTTIQRTTPADVVALAAKPTPTSTPCPPEGCPTPTITPTPAPQTGLDFSLGIDVNGDGTDDCSTKVGGPTKCSLSAGSIFTVKVYLNGLPVGVAEYGAFDLYLTFTGVTSKFTHIVPWPDCGIPFSIPPHILQPGEVGWGCGIGIGADPSTYTGLIGTNDFNCVASGAVTMVHGENDTSLTAPNIQVHSEGEGTTETLTINCVAPVGGISVDPDLGALPLETSGSPGANAGMLAGIAAGVAAGAVVLVGAAWYARRRW